MCPLLFIEPASKDEGNGENPDDEKGNEKNLDSNKVIEVHNHEIDGNTASNTGKIAKAVEMAKRWLRYHDHDRP